jgi:hypothetical protein
VSTTSVFSAVADPTRRAMIDLLATGPRSAGGDCQQLPQADSARCDTTSPGAQRCTTGQRDRSGLAEDICPKARRPPRPARLDLQVSGILGKQDGYPRRAP